MLATAACFAAADRALGEWNADEAKTACSRRASRGARASDKG